MELALVSITEKVRDLSCQKSLHEEGQECNVSGPGKGKRKAGKLERHLVSISGIREHWEEQKVRKGSSDWRLLRLRLNIRGIEALRKSYIFLEESP